MAKKWPKNEYNFFWKNQSRYLCLGFQGQEPVDLKITCPEQSIVLGYSTTPLPLTTATATVTATTAVRTTTNKSEESDSRFAADSGDKKTSGGITQLQSS